MTDTNDQPGACAPVPLPETHCPFDFMSDIPVVTLDDAIAYGEACAAYWRARAEAAEAKIAEMEGRR